MWSAPNVRGKIKDVDVVVSPNHVAFLTNGFSRLISFSTSPSLFREQVISRPF